MPAHKKALYILGDNLIEKSTEKETLKNQKGENDGKWLEKSKQNC